jgi:hypothetical protein
MRNNEIRYTSIQRNLRVTEFRWKPYLKTDLNVENTFWLFRQFGFN